MPVSLPERTVDAWVTAYVAKRVPDALLWAPTQRQIPDYDLASSLPGPGKLFVFENKAPYTNRAHHHFILYVRQIWNYLRVADLRARTFYVLPCPPFPVSEVPSGPGAIESAQPDLVPRRAQARLAGNPWAPAQACEEWFRVVPVVDLWTHFFSQPPPAEGAPEWPKRRRGQARSVPAGAPNRDTVPLTCPLPTSLGESLEMFMDHILRCDRPNLRVDQEQIRDTARLQVNDARDSPLYQALIAFAPASNLPGWTGSQTAQSS